MRGHQKLWIGYGKDYATFQKVLQRLKLPPDIWPELAVLLAEIKAPTIAVGNILDRICQTQKCSQKELDALQELIAYRWRWHAQDLDLLLEKLEMSGFSRPRKQPSTPKSRRRQPPKRANS